MANKGNYMPIKLYKKMLTESYFKAYMDGNSIKDYLNKDFDPIIQKQDRYIPPPTRGNVLTEEYIKRMANKPEKPHIRRIPLKANLTSGVKVIEKPGKSQGIRMNPKVRKNQLSTKSYECSKHIRTYNHPETLKNFYFDNFNSAKQNQYECERRRANVIKKIYNFIIF